MFPLLDPFAVFLDRLVGLALNGPFVIHAWMIGDRADIDNHWRAPLAGKAAAQADFRCGLAAFFLAAPSFAGFLPAIDISISF